MRSDRALSLRARLLLWLLVPLGGLALMNLALARREARRTADMVQDRLLLGSARIIAQQIRFEDGLLDVAIPPAALELFQSGAQDRVYYRIASPQGVLLSGYAELPSPAEAPRPEESVYFQTEVRGEPVRVVAYAQPVFAAPAEGPVIIEVAQTLQDHDQLARKLWTTTLRQDLWTLALAGLLIWFALRRGLKDILRLRDEVGRRTPGSLEPLRSGPMPQELQPLVGALNGYIQRLDAQMAVRSRFIANASHQLRTPFAVLQTQASHGLRSADPALKDEVLEAMSGSVRQGTRLVNQLLALSRAEAGTLAHRPGERVDLADLAQRVLEEQATLAQSRNIDLGFDRPEGRLDLAAPSAMLHELVANLVDNALRYTPPGGRVTLALRRADGAPVLAIEDNGPGIPPADRVRVFERFCRLGNDDTPGCGLGLSIVQEVARALGAEVRLSDPASGSGLVVTVAFPAGLAG
ncbi:sensor histidine kinase [Geothrix edaphica]|uniref:histidine kinase n=1 Tax=Geothrix edaphica TaxID=2927976 RepID=A0ABQ5PZA6_9BACT|nr:sensor histidine kinase [Geothrix edaphica]GLH67722.1 sensor histidine kinase [Geothrix edaphica]